MRKTEFLAAIDEILEQPAGTLQGDETLSSLPRWDSLAIIGFIALLDAQFGMQVPATEILECRTVADLTALTKGRVHG